MISIFKIIDYKKRTNDFQKRTNVLKRIVEPAKLSHSIHSTLIDKNDSLTNSLKKIYVIINVSEQKIVIP